MGVLTESPKRCRSAELEPVALAEEVRRLVGGGQSVTFGELRQDGHCRDTFDDISGTLELARKRGLVCFEGELLCAGAHDDFEITLGEATRAPRHSFRDTTAMCSLFAEGSPLQRR